MIKPSLHTSALAAVAGGAAFAFTGALQATHEFGGTHNTIDSTAEYLVTAGFAAAQLLTAQIYRHLGRMGDAARAGLAVAVALTVLGTMSASSVVMGEDAAFFNAVAPLCLLTWLGGSVLIARGLRRSHAVPNAVAIGLPLTFVTTIPLSMIGGPLLTGVYWMVVGARLAGYTRVSPASAQPATSV